MGGATWAVYGAPRRVQRSHRAGAYRKPASNRKSYRRYLLDVGPHPLVPWTPEASFRTSPMHLLHRLGPPWRDIYAPGREGHG
jgi:hypothetical protein